MTANDTYDGGCTCGAVRYRMTSMPMFVHCCHCRWCQRETGASFARKSRAAPPAVSRSGATMPAPAMRCGSSASAPSTSPIVCRRMSTFSPTRNSLGWFCTRVRRPSPNSTIARNYGRKKAWRGAKLCWRKSGKSELRYIKYLTIWVLLIAIAWVAVLLICPSCKVDRFVIGTLGGLFHRF